VTTIDSHEHFVYAGSLEGSLGQWDLRVARARAGAPMQPVQAASIDGSAVLRCALGPRPGWAAVSTLNGLYCLNPFDVASPASARAHHSARPKNSHTPAPPGFSISLLHMLATFHACMHYCSRAPCKSQQPMFAVLALSTGL
jgi:hypothetical protein